MILDEVQLRLFPANSWISGDQPCMVLTLDTQEVPDTAPARMTCEALGVLSAEVLTGLNVNRQEADTYQLCQFFNEFLKKPAILPII